jgi:hypothetical protein
LNLGAKEGLNLRNNWMKSIACERHFLLTLCCCRQKVSWTKAAAALDSFENCMDAGERSECLKTAAHKTACPQN